MQVATLPLQKATGIVRMFIQIVNITIQISKLKRRNLPSAVHFEAGVTQLAEYLPSKNAD